LNDISNHQLIIIH